MASQCTRTSCGHDDSLICFTGYLMFHYDCCDPDALFHRYRDTPPETALDDYVALRSLITKYAPAGKEDMPIYIGEWGYTTATPPCTYGNRVDEATQAKYLARIWLTSAMIGSPATINYDWKVRPSVWQLCDSYCSCNEFHVRSLRLSCAHLLPFTSFAGRWS